MYCCARECISNSLFRGLFNGCSSNGCKLIEHINYCLSASFGSSGMPNFFAFFLALNLLLAAATIFLRCCFASSDCEKKSVNQCLIYLIRQIICSCNSLTALYFSVISFVFLRDCASLISGFSVFL